MNSHHYTECGLQNVYVSGLEHGDRDDPLIIIPSVNLLHRTISTGIVCHAHSMSGDELRFLRSEMGYTQAELADVLHMDKQTIGRWERSEFSIDPLAETLIRRLAIEKLNLDVQDGVDILSQRSVPGTELQVINIGLEKNSYALLAA
jgi:transcriptional regulator with XRE-family HTH domain